MSKHAIANVFDHVATQIAGVAEASVALGTHAGLLPGVNPHVDLQVAALSEALHAMVTPVGLLAGVGTHVDGHLCIVGENLATQSTGPALAAAAIPSQLLAAEVLPSAVQALGHAVVRRQRAQGLQLGRGEEGVMAVRRQWALPFSVDVQDPQVPVATGRADLQTFRGGASLCAVVPKDIAVFYRGEKERQKLY